AAGRTGGGLLQVHVARAPRDRVAVLRRATVDPRRVRRQHGGARLVILALEALRAGIQMVLDLVSPNSPTATRHQPVPMDPLPAPRPAPAHPPPPRHLHAAGAEPSRPFWLPSPAARVPRPGPPHRHR